MHVAARESHRGTVLALLALVAGLLAGPVPPAHGQPVGCPEILRAADVRAGAVGTGYTVASGTVPEAFTVRVLGVLDDGIAVGVDLIVVEVDSADLRRAGGIWAGMSGAPVYIDGKLAGALAYGLSSGPSLVGGLTPAEQVSALLERPPGPATGADAVRTGEREAVELPDSMVDRLAEEHDLGDERLGRLTALPVAVSVPGLGGPRRQWLSERFAHHGLNAVVVGGASGDDAAAASGDDAAATDAGDDDARGDVTGEAATGEAAPGTLVAGGNAGVGLSAGDVTMVGVGTVTLVCDGAVVLFGHPFLWSGPTGLSLHPASGIGIVTDPQAGPYKLAEVGSAIGTADIDGLAGVRGRTGQVPQAATVTSSITNEDERRTATGQTDIVFDELLPELAVSHLWTNFDVKAHDDLSYAGTADVTWTVRGHDAAGDAWSLERANRHADAQDLSSASTAELYETLSRLQHNDFEDIVITDIQFGASSVGAVRQARIVADEAEMSTDGTSWRPFGRAPLRVRPGKEIRLRVPVQRHQRGQHVLEIAVAVPFTAASTAGELTVAAGRFAADECLELPEECGSEDRGRIDSFDELLESLRARGRNDDVVASLGLQAPANERRGEARSASATWGPPTVTRLERAQDVVTGRAVQAVEVVESCAGSPAFADVAPGSAHASNVACAASIGVAKGVGDRPLRFAPERAVTRAQAASLVARALRAAGHKLPAPGAPVFSDVSRSPHADAIHALGAARIVSGRAADRYVPGETIRRDQMSSLLVRAVEWARQRRTEPPVEQRFDDVPASSVHAGNVRMAADLGLVRGLGGRIFAPADATRRDQTASLVLRMVDLLNAPAR